MIDMINTKTINKMIVNGFTPLNSVGSLLDEDTGTIYPQMIDGSPDWDDPISLYDDEVSSEWIESLSSEDYNICKPFLNL
jgi:hypothetical protein